MDPLQWTCAKSGQKYAQIKHYLQVKNSSKQVCRILWIMDLYFGQKWQF